VTVVGVVLVPVPVLVLVLPLPLAGVPVDTAVPRGFRISLYRVPSAVFISVTGLFSRSVMVCAPVAYEPPAIEIFAVWAVTDTRWKTGTSVESVDVGCGKSVFVATV
jgi:hypothetical protein